MGAFANSNSWITGNIPPRIPAGSEVVSQRFTLALGTGDLDASDYGQVGWLPAGCLPVDVHVDGSDMDSSTAALIFSIGILADGGTDLSTAAADGGGKWGDTTASNAAFYQRMTPYLNNMMAVTATSTNRKLALKVATAPTTAVAGTVGVTLFYRAA